ncbi:cupin domain-containing protein [Streptomyces sp. NPDC053086]|uniref:cupin domain-containing protein n=1 Tax=unclassified Streptomyces TaxID=2593676 RepID=UPI0037D08630
MCVSGHIDLSRDTGDLLRRALPELIHVRGAAAEAPVLRWLTAQLSAETAGGRAGSAFANGRPRRGPCPSRSARGDTGPAAFRPTGAGNMPREWPKRHGDSDSVVNILDCEVFTSSEVLITHRT